MKTVTKLWVGLIAIYIAVLAWHQPLRGPLTEAEVRAFLAPQIEASQVADEAQTKAFLDFFLSDDGKPFYMVNLNVLPDDTQPEAAAHTESEANSYAVFMIPRLLARASYPVLSIDPILMLNNSVGPDLAAIDRVIVVRYRSRRDFLHIIGTPEFRAASDHKQASLDGWYAAPAAIRPTLSLPRFALILLVFVGGVGTLLSRRKRWRFQRQITSPRET